MEEKISAVRQQKQAEVKANELRQAEEKERWVNNTKMIFAQRQWLIIFLFGWLANTVVLRSDLCMLTLVSIFFIIYVLFYQLVIFCCWLKFTSTIVATTANPDKIIWTLRFSV